MVKVSNCFACDIGLRQGENLYPFLFSIYLNDLESFFFRHDNTSGIECESSSDQTFTIYSKLFILLYADDTVIISESKDGLQSALSTYSEYCNEWRLTITVDKSKVMVFSKGRQTEYSFQINNNDIEVVKEFKYLGVLFSRSGSFNAAKKLKIISQTKPKKQCIT